MVFIFRIIILHPRLKPVILSGLNTSLAGLIVNIVYISQAIYQLICDTEDALCEFRGFLVHCSSGLLFHTFCIQALHRLFVNVYSRQRRFQTTHFMFYLITIQWFISLVFAIPILLTDRIKYFAPGEICQIAIDDVFGFLYLATFIFLLPVSIIIYVYIVILIYVKQNTFIANIRLRVIETRRRRRALQLMGEVFSLVSILLVTGFPYIALFLIVNLTSIPLPTYGHRVIFMLIASGQGTVMSLTTFKNR